MTPKEKAKDLIFEFCNIDSDSEMYDNFKMPDFYAQRCALIAVDDIIGQWKIIDVYLADGNGELNQNLKYWYKVKKEIEKL